MYFSIRVLLVSISVGSVTFSYFLNESYVAIKNMQLASEDLYWLIAYLLLAVVVAWVAIVSRCRLSGEPAIWPSWYSNPFSFRQPASFFHMIGWVLIAYGLADLIVGWALYGIVSRIGAIGLVMGIGVGMGIKFAVGNSSSEWDQ